MNILEEDVKEAILRLSDADLTKFIEIDFREHTEEAVAFAREELTRRDQVKKKIAPAEAVPPEAKSAVPEPKADAPAAKSDSKLEARPPQPEAAPAASVVSPPEGQPDAEPPPSDASEDEPRRRGLLSRLLRRGKHRSSE